ncbi:cell wall protein [Streptomyces sp. NPDC096013]|uniref:cell wall protein n=1 Tax=Streptomyces sp. NPDC096013 TaxID=3366069 RepID=UPI0037F24303
MSALARYVSWPQREERAAQLPFPVPRLAGPAWPAWRRHRAVYRTTAVFAVLAALWSVEEHYQLVSAVHHYADLCRAAPHPCDSAIGGVATPTIAHMSPSVLRYLPLAVGALVGGPLFAQDMESGTHRLAWTQSVGRREWAAVKLGVATAVTTAAAVVLTVPVTWWWYSAWRGHNGGPDRSAWRAIVWWNDWDFFAWTGPVGVAHLLLALMLGAATGVLVRRTLPAVALSAGLGEAVLFGLEKLRPHLLTPHIHRTRGLGFPNSPRDGWYQRVGYVRADGSLTASLPPCAGRDLHAFSTCMRQQQIVGRYNRSFTMDQFLPLQLIETGICLAATAALAAFCLWYLPRVTAR